MKAAIAFMFFMLFLAGIAFVNLRGMGSGQGTMPVTVEMLASSAWRPERLAEMPLDAATAMRVQFEQDGTLSGHGGCNRFTGGFQIVDEVLKIGPLGATRMACPEPAMSFEIAFLDALESVTMAEAHNGRIILKNASGDALVRMVAIDRDSTP